VAPPATTAPPATAAAPAPPTATSGVTPPAAPIVAPTAAGPLVAYVKHTKPPVLIDTTPGKAAFAMVGAFAAISAGGAIVTDNAIPDPSGDMAHDIATAYAAAHGGRVADAPILDDHQMTRPKGEDLAKESNGANFVIDVDPPGMNLIYFGFDWTHFDMLFLSVARVIDTSNGKVVAHGHCFLRTDKTGAQTHDALLADHAAALKALIVTKSQACVVQMKAELKL